MAEQKQLREEDLIQVSGGAGGASGGTDYITYVLTFKDPSGHVGTRDFNGMLFGPDECSAKAHAYKDAYRQAEQFLQSWGFTFVNLKEK